MKEYVLGFAFDLDSEIVVLIRKNSPEWQKGLLNGIGGKIEPNEGIFAAMIRKFKEETGVYIRHWDYIGKLHGAGFIVHILTAYSNDITLCETVTDEEVTFINSNEVITFKDSIIPNLQWIIPLAKQSYGYFPFDIKVID